MNAVVKIKGLNVEAPRSLEGFRSILRWLPEFDNATMLFHSPKYHPEGDHSLAAHMEAVYAKWLEQIPCLCNAPHSHELAFWAILFHDIGKDACAKAKGDGTSSFIKHESEGMKIFNENYADWFSPENAEAIAYCIKEHTNFWFIAKHGKVEAMKNHPHFWLLAEVALCDKMGFKDDEWSERLSFFGFEKREGCACKN
jgi:hypothetical protein